jgi:hypothetical protein
MDLKKSNIIDSEHFGESSEHYFVDLKVSRNRRTYLKITRRNSTPGTPYDGSAVILFEDDFAFFIEALSMVMGRYSHGEGQPA